MSTSSLLIQEVDWTASPSVGATDQDEFGIVFTASLSITCARVGPTSSIVARLIRVEASLAER